MGVSPGFCVATVGDAIEDRRFGVKSVASPGGPAQ